MSDPYTSPELYDFYTLDGVRAPGISFVESGGERVEEFTDQQVPMTRGATTLFRFEPNGEITYTHKLWLAEHFTAWRAYVAMLNEGKNRTPQPRVYVLADERLEDVQMTKAGFQGIGSRANFVRGQPTFVKVRFKEVRRQKPYGGAALPADNETFKKLSGQLSAQAAANDKVLAAHAAARAKK